MEQDKELPELQYEKFIIDPVKSLMNFVFDSEYRYIRFNISRQVWQETNDLSSGDWHDMRVIDTQLKS